jgi:hypothetical protein
MGRPQAVEINKRIAKTLATHLANSTEELARALVTSSATILRFRATGLITLSNLKKLACYYFFPSSSLDEILVGERLIQAEIPLAVKLFIESDPLTYHVSLLHKEKGQIHINVLWKKDFEKVKGNSVLIKALKDVGYHYIIVIDKEEMPIRFSLQELEESLPKEMTNTLCTTSTENLVKALSERGYKVTLEIMSEK